MINILIVEDNPNKKDKILSVIKGIDIPQGNIETVINIKEAQIQLRKNHFDLMVLDLALPIDADDKIPLPENGINFLKDINANPNIQPPTYIVGLTEFLEYKEKYATDFSERLWYLINYKENESDWKEQLKSIIYHLIKLRCDFLNSKNIKNNCDIAIITALSEELSPILQLPANWSPLKVENDATRYQLGHFERNSKKLKVICASAPQMGMVASATLAMKMIITFRPRYIVMTGIAAGYKSSNNNIGDILIIDQSYDGTSGKVMTQIDNTIKFEPNPTYVSLDPDLKEKLREFEAKVELFAKIKRDFQGNTPNAELKCHIGPVVSVPYVVQNEDKFLDFKKIQRKLLGLEMEAFGVFYSAANSSNPKAKAIVIKSICDFGDKEKADDFHKYAAYTSAKFLYEFALEEL